MRRARELEPCSTWGQDVGWDRLGDGARGINNFRLLPLDPALSREQRQLRPAISPSLHLSRRTLQGDPSSERALVSGGLLTVAATASTLIVAVHRLTIRADITSAVPTNHPPKSRWVSRIPSISPSWPSRPSAMKVGVRRHARESRDEAGADVFLPQKWSRT